MEFRDRGRLKSRILRRMILPLPVAAFGILPLLTASPVSASPISASPQVQLNSLRDSVIASTLPASGAADTNPYGIAIVPKTVGNLVAGDILVPNFNNASTPGAGTSIMEVNPTTGATSIFYRDTTGTSTTGPVQIAINPALDIVWVGSYGSAKDSSGNYSGALSNVVLITPTGTVAATFSTATTSDTPAGSWSGVWGQAVSDVNSKISFYWTTAGNGVSAGGGVYRVDPNPNGTPNGQPVRSTYVTLATGLPTSGLGSNATNAAGPQGMVFDSANNTLYVADDSNGDIYAIANANSATGAVTPTVLYTGLNSPQNITINPTNGDLLVVDGATDNNLSEISTSGTMVGSLGLVPTEAPGALFGLAATTGPSGNLVIYYTDANTNTIHELSPLTSFGTHMVASDGGVFSFGNTGFYGSMGGKTLNAPIVGMASTPDGKGYWLVAKDGGVFSFGDASFYGSMGAVMLNKPVVGIASTPDGGGYWLVASDGGVFSFGDASFYGSMGAVMLNKPVVGMTASPDGKGYTLVASDGGTFNFGDAKFYGSLANMTLNAPIVGISTGY